MRRNDPKGTDFLGRPVHENIPKRPRKHRVKPPNAFLLFCRDRRQDLCSKCPGLKAHEVTALLSHLWRTLDEDAKEHYRQSAQSFLDHANNAAQMPPPVMVPVQGVAPKPDKVYFPPLDPGIMKSVGQGLPFDLPVLKSPGQGGAQQGAPPKPR